MRRTLRSGYELDDDPDRLDLDRIVDYLAGESYWAKGRSRGVIEASLRGSTRVIGLYHDSVQVGLARVITDGATQAYLADVYVLGAHRGRGLGKELVAEAVDRGPHAGLKWLLHTADAHDLYRRYGFGTPSDRLMERPERRPGRRSPQP